MWISYLKYNHHELYQQFLAEQVEAKSRRDGSAFIELLVIDQRWSAKVKQLLLEKSHAKSS